MRWEIRKQLLGRICLSLTVGSMLFLCGCYQVSSNGDTAYSETPVTNNPDLLPKTIASDLSQFEGASSFAY